jgi:FtsH-binding integral membrane protein
MRRKEGNMTPPTATGITSDRQEIRGGLAWTLAIDLCGTVALCTAWVFASTSEDSAVLYYRALAVVATAGAALAIVAVTIAAGTLRHRVPSRRALLVSATAAALGLGVNTAGVMWVLSMPNPGHVGAAVLLLFVGDALGIIYLLLIGRALVATRSTVGQASL